MQILKRNDPQSYKVLKEKYVAEDIEFAKTKEAEQLKCEDEHMESLLHDYFEHGHDSGDEHDTRGSFLRNEALTPLYAGSNLTRLSASLLILNLQTRFGWSNVGVSTLLE